MNPIFEKKAKEVVELVLDQLDKHNRGNWMYEAAYPVIRLGKKAFFEWLYEHPEEVYEYLKKTREKIDEGIKIYEDEARPKP